jgi:hypothetical protein
VKIMPRKVPAPDDLRAAGEWLSYYESAGADDHTTARMHAVGLWLEAEADRREIESLVAAASEAGSIERHRLRMALRAGNVTRPAEVRAVIAGLDAEGVRE